MKEWQIQALRAIDGAATRAKGLVLLDPSESYDSVFGGIDLRFRRNYPGCTVTNSTYESFWSEARGD